MADKEEEELGKQAEETGEERPSTSELASAPSAPAPSKAALLPSPAGPSKAPPPPPPGSPRAGRGSRGSETRAWGAERILVPLVVVVLGMATLWWGTARAVEHQYLLAFLGAALVFGAVGLYMWLAGRTTVPMVVHPVTSGATQLYPGTPAWSMPPGSAPPAAQGPWWPPQWNGASSRAAVFAASLSVVAVLLAGVGLAMGVDAKVTTNRVDAAIAEVKTLTGAATRAQAETERARLAQYRVVLAEGHGIAQAAGNLDARVRLLERTVTGLQGQNVATLKAARDELSALQQYQEQIDTKTEQAVERLEQEERGAVTGSRDALNALREAVPATKADLRANIESLKETMQSSSMVERRNLVPVETSARVEQAQREAQGAQL